MPVIFMVSAIIHIKAVELYHLIVHLKRQAALKNLEELGEHVCCLSISGIPH
jgi:hypothetical protein